MASPTTALVVPDQRADTAVVETKAMGGGLEGAERTARELFSWDPRVISPDQQNNPVKEMADARGRDSAQNDGYILGALNVHRDNIVGSQYRLNATPDYDLLGADEAWAEEFQKAVESRFNALADSEECWFDASRMNTLTGMVRLAIGGFMLTGEVLGTAEWLRGAGRPFSTAIQLISPSRLSNPDLQPDSKFLRRGVVQDIFGAPQSYWIRNSHPSEFYELEDTFQWRNVPAAKPWGRKQVIHIIEQLQPAQSRGIADMVSVLKQMRMTKKFQDITLQNAVIQASYAAAIESELPPEVVFKSMGAGGAGLTETVGEYLKMLGQYVNGGNNINVDGAKMPLLFPGTKLNLKPMGTPGGVGSGFEESLLRHTASALGLSYEQFSRDYTKTNYSSARASMSETWKYMLSRKKHVADRFATIIYVLWMEEQINAGNLPLPAGKTSAIFYDPVMREALTACTWIGASRGQVDEMKETQAALMRIDGGLSTYETECARLGEDFRRVFSQRAREERMKKELKLVFNTTGEKPTAPTSAGQQQLGGDFANGGKQDNQDNQDE
jgi:lambda family phage portal protein